MKNKNEFDVIFIVAGVIGCSITIELSLLDLKTAVVEKASYLCSGQSKTIGAIVHEGHDPRLPDVSHIDVSFVSTERHLFICLNKVCDSIVKFIRCIHIW